MICCGHPLRVRQSSIHFSLYIVSLNLHETLGRQEVFGSAVPLGRLAMVTQVINGAARIQTSQSASTSPGSLAIQLLAWQVFKTTWGPQRMLSECELLREAAIAAGTSRNVSRRR